MKLNNPNHLIILILTLLIASCMSSQIARIKDGYMKVPETKARTIGIPTYKSPHPLAGLADNIGTMPKKKKDN